MWILDSAYRDEGIDLWTKDGTVSKVHHNYNPPFHVHFHDPHAHYEMIEALEERYGAEECTIRTIFGKLPGYAVTAGRVVAEAIEKQAQYGSISSTWTCAGTSGSWPSARFSRALRKVTTGSPRRSGTIFL